MEEPCEGYSQMLKDVAQAIEDCKIERQFKKSELFKENAPSWLADEFDIKWIRHTNMLDDGQQIITPYGVGIIESFDMNKYYDVVVLWIGGDGTDIQLF